MVASEQSGSTNRAGIYSLYQGEQESFQVKHRVVVLRNPRRGILKNLKGFLITKYTKYTKKDFLKNYCFLPHEKLILGWIDV